MKEAAEWYRRAASGGIPEGAMRLGRLRLAGGSPQSNRDAYFWYSLAAYRKAPGAEAAQQSVAAKLSPKELSDQQKKFSEWLKMRLYDQLAHFHDGCGRFAGQELPITVTFDGLSAGLETSPSRYTIPNPAHPKGSVVRDLPRGRLA